METGDTFTLDLANDLIIVDSDIFANILIINNSCMIPRSRLRDPAGSLHTVNTLLGRPSYIVPHGHVSVASAPTGSASPLLANSIRQADAESELIVEPQERCGEGREGRDWLIPHLERHP